MKPRQTRALGVTLLMAIWWVTECIPIYATAFIPIALFPLLGILMQVKPLRIMATIMF
jgi:sodium-dependent dicarboxylate transporter 2/3/5